MTHIGREYAAALFSCARETGERFSDALCAVETLFADNPQYVALLSSPAVLTAADKTCVSCVP